MLFIPFPPNDAGHFIPLCCLGSHNKEIKCYGSIAFMIDADNKHLQKGNWKDIGLIPTIRSSMLKLVYTTTLFKKKKKKVD
jgi:hypothetical protein